LLDDARVGLSEGDLVSAVALIKKAKESSSLSWQQIAIILTSLGLSATGIWLILIAVADPEPTSRLGILLTGGVILILTGGLSILRALGQTWKVSKGKKSFAIEPS